MSGVRNHAVLRATRKNSSTMSPTTRRRYWYSTFEIRIPDWLLRRAGIEVSDRVAVQVIKPGLLAVMHMGTRGAPKATVGEPAPKASEPAALELPKLPVDVRL